jgi:ribosomal protein S12 methylthiotransferase accessory factor
MIGKVELEIQVPPSFPEKYLPAMIRAADLCAVKRHMQQPPAFDIHTAVVEPAV